MKIDTGTDRLGMRPDLLTEAVLRIDPESKDFRKNLLDAIRANLQDGEIKAAIVERNLTDQAIKQLRRAIKSQNGPRVRMLLSGLTRDIPVEPVDQDLESLDLGSKGHLKDPSSVMFVVRDYLRLAFSNT